jgi:DNA-binding transcriptional MerR regulator
MSNRTYLSIGDVLALLRQEFPDVTISKIRFLESQGLVNPERTPSGYRKFYETDVERLRWVLRQQREHFLPLKVIKGRLEQEVADYGDDNGHDGTSAHVLVGRASAPAGPRAPSRELPGFEAGHTGADARRGRAAVGGTGSEPARGADLASASAPVGTASRQRGSGPPPGGPVPGRGRPGAAPAPSSGAPATRSSSPPAGAGQRSADARTAARPSGAGTGPVAGAAVPSGPAQASKSPGSGHTGPGRRGGDTVEAGDGGDELADELVVGALSGASMTIEELAQGAAIDVTSVEELESYGLLCGRQVGGVSYYDEDALTVARVAAGLARYGVEARHLRFHKHAAEREAGFIEQIVLPLLKQRNPEARVRAQEIVTELSQLGQALREVLLRTTLRDQLGR